MTAKSKVNQLVGIHQGIEFHSTWLGCSAVSAPRDAFEDTPDARWTPVPEVGDKSDEGLLIPSIRKLIVQV